MLSNQIAIRVFADQARLSFDGEWTRAGGGIRGTADPSSSTSGSQEGAKGTIGFEAGQACIEW